MLETVNMKVEFVGGYYNKLPRTYVNSILEGLNMNVDLGDVLTHELKLKREPTNVHDSNAIGVYMGNAADGYVLTGHITRTGSTQLAPLMDKGYTVNLTSALPHDTEYFLDRLNRESFLEHMTFTVKARESESAVWYAPAGIKRGSKVETAPLPTDIEASLMSEERLAAVLEFWEDELYRQLSNRPLNKDEIVKLGNKTCMLRRALTVKQSQHMVSSLPTNIDPSTNAFGGGVINSPVFEGYGHKLGYDAPTIITACDGQKTANEACEVISVERHMAEMEELVTKMKMESAEMYQMAADLAADCGRTDDAEYFRGKLDSLSEEQPKAEDFFDQLADVIKKNK
jgi:hypothetical protein